jgi:selenoprotein W-related protein
LASQLLSQLKQRIVSLELVPSDGGCFEVAVDGKQVYSKLQTGEFPDEQGLVATLTRMAK